MSKNDSISILQASMLIITASGILDHVIIIPVILEQAHRSAWFSALLAGILLPFWCLILYFIMKRSGQQHLFAWMKSIVGDWGARIILLFILLQLFLMNVMSLRDTIYWANTTYLPRTPNIVLTGTFLLIALFAASSGLNTVAIVNGILLPIVVILGFFVMTSNSPFKDYSLLFPLFEDGFGPVVKGIIYAAAGYSEIIFLLFFQHRLRSKMKFLPLFITSVALVDLMLSVVTGAIAIFGPDEAVRTRYPAYEQWRMITFGHFLEHVDFFSIYQWLAGGFIRLSLGLYLIADLANLKKGKKRFFWSMLILFILTVAATRAPVSDKTFLIWITTLYLPFSLSLHMALLLLLGTMALIRTKKKVEA